MRIVSAAILLCTLTACGPKVVPERSEKPWFQDVAEQTGIKFVHFTGATGQFYMPEIMGSGCALLDYDGDGDLDVLLLQGAPLEGTSGGTGSRFFRNELIPSGELKFIDVTKQVALEHNGYAMGAATGDIDNDGHIDVLVTGYGGNVLYRNNGDGTFRNAIAESKDLILAGRWSSSASFFDYDRDDKQDLVILEYLDYSLKINKQCRAPSGEITYCTPRAYNATSIHLFHNQGGRFVDVTKRSGIDRASGRGLGVAAFDANNDAWPDLFVANDASANHLWINQKNGTFVERALQAGVAYGDEGLAKAGMGVAVGDYDNDGDDDLAVLNLLREGATVHENLGGGKFTYASNFADASIKTGIHALTFAYTGFGTGWFDFDNDGWLDIFLANGAVTLREEQRGQPYPFRERNLLIRNPGASGGRFIDATGTAGSVFGLLEVSRGAAFGDVDNDGDIDILLTNNNGPARLLRNSAPQRKWLSVQVDAPGLGTGTRISVKAAGLPELWRTVRTDSSYLSASDRRVHFGLADAGRIERVTVHWPSGGAINVDAKSNSLVRVSRASP